MKIIKATTVPYFNLEIFLESESLKKDCLTISQYIICSENRKSFAEILGLIE